jgi:hypothetical protein
VDDIRLPEETLAALLQHSPFVPAELIATFTRASRASSRGISQAPS